MKKIIIAIACCALVFNGAEAKKKKEVKKEEGFVFTTVKENPITSIKNQHAGASADWHFSKANLSVWVKELTIWQKCF